MCSCGTIHAIMKRIESAGGRPTIRDIARESGYSKTAVSFAFNDPSRISRAACLAIYDTAKRLGYLPDPAARNLSRGKRSSIGILGHFWQHDQSSRILQGVESICLHHHYNLTLLTETKASLQTANIDAFILIGSFALAAQVAEVRHLPFVTIDSRSDFVKSDIWTDYQNVVQNQIDLARSFRHKKIVILSDMKNLTSDYPILGTQHASIEEGKRLGLKLAQARSLPDCILATSDYLAIGCILGLKQSGISVPMDVSVIGCGNLEAGALITPSLTTFDIHSYEKGRLAAMRLFNLLEQPQMPSAPECIQPSLVMRSSLTVPR